MKNWRITKTGIGIILLIVVTSLFVKFGGVNYLNDAFHSFTHHTEEETVKPSNTTSSNTGSNSNASVTPTIPTAPVIKDSRDKTIHLSLDEWIGWKPIIDANGGLETQKGSIFDKLGINVKIVIINDGTTSSNALVTGELTAAGYTTNRTAFLSKKFKDAKVDVVMPVFTNYSAGGDGIIAKDGINSVRDLIGKKIGVPRFSEAQTLVAWFVIKADDLSDNEKKDILDNLILFEDASETGEAFYAGKLDVAATWQPYLSDTAKNPGSHIMFSTLASKSLIMDGILFRADFAEAHPDIIGKFIEGIFEAESLYTSKFDAIRAVMPMFADSSDQDIIDMSADAELMDYAQNVEVLDSTAPSVYSDMCKIWSYLGEESDPKMAMTLFDTTYISTLSNKYSSTPITENKVEITPEQKEAAIDYPALLTKSATVEFNGDMATFKNKEEAYKILDEFVEVAKTLDGSIIQIEGNINAWEDTESGRILSLERAKAVRKYFTACGIDEERIIVIGNGNTKMVTTPDSADAGRNRRTDVFFKLVEGAGR